jgi:hypothetical protein
VALILAAIGAVTSAGVASLTVSPDGRQQLEMPAGMSRVGAGLLMLLAAAGYGLAAYLLAARRRGAWQLTFALAVAGLASLPLLKFSFYSLAFNVTLLLTSLSRGVRQPIPNDRGVVRAPDARPEAT